MQSETKFYGKAIKYTLAASISSFDPRFARLHFADVGSDCALTLITSGIPRGYFFFFTSLSSSIGIVTINSTTVSAGQTALGYFDGSTWRFIKFAFGTSALLARVHARVYVVGGTGTSGTSVYYTPSTNTWAAGPSPANAKVEAGAALNGALGYFVGTDPIATASQKNDELNIRTAAFANRTDFPAQIMRLCAAFGLNSSSIAAVFFYGGDASSTVRSYVFDAYTTQLALPMKRSRGIAVSVARQDLQERRVFIMNGGDPTGQPVLGHMTRADFYWSVTTQPGASRRSVAGFSRNGRVHQVGGYLDSPVTRYDLNEEYDPSADVWTTRAALGLGQRYGGAGASGTSRGFYCGGKDSADAAQAGASAYIRDAWAGIASMPAARSEVRASGVST